MRKSDTALGPEITALMTEALEHRLREINPEGALVELTPEEEEMLRLLGHFL